MIAEASGAIKSDLQRMCELSKTALDEYRLLRKDVMRRRGGYQSQAMVPDPEWCFELEDAIDSVEKSATLLKTSNDMLDALRCALQWIESDEATHGRAFTTGDIVRAAISNATSAVAS